MTERQRDLAERLEVPDAFLSRTDLGRAGVGGADAWELEGLVTRSPLVSVAAWSQRELGGSLFFLARQRASTLGNDGPPRARAQSRRDALVNLLDIRVGCNKQRAKQPAAVDVVVVWPAAWSVVVDRAAKLDSDRCAGGSGIGVRVESQQRLMDVRRTGGLTWAHGSAERNA